MSSRSKKVKSVMGRALYNSCSDRHRGSTGSRVAKHTSLIEKQEAPRVTTILEQTQLDEFIQTTELARANYDAERAEFVSADMQLIRDAAATPAPRSKYELEEAASRILRRPQWTRSMTGNQVKAMEDQAFLDWRRNLADLEENEGVILSPFERNVDFWRQLWRTVERSDVVVQIVDARDPLFFLSEDLFRYVAEVGVQQEKPKKCVLLVNKSDFVAPALRAEWDIYFRRNHPDIQVVNFSALADIVAKTPELEVVAGAPIPILGSYTAGSDILDAEQLVDLLSAMGENITVGMVGFPNVGKSSVINALLGTKKVSASSTPGKTKQIQTITLNDNVTLCDCPGIVLPSVVASKAHLVVNATMPLDHLKGGAIPAVELVVQRIGMESLVQYYKCEHSMLPQFKKLGSDARQLLSAVAVAKKYFLALNVPDEQKAARVVLKDVCEGRLVHVMLPPGSSMGADLDLNSDDGEFERVDLRDGSDEFVEVIEEDTLGEIEDDIAGFMASHCGQSAPRNVTKDDLKPLTKRALRMGAKKDMRSVNKFCPTQTAAQDELTRKINSLKPGSRGRVSKALADPYGCHAANEL
jgi:large subunit GTPase 1